MSGPRIALAALLLAGLLSACGPSVPAFCGVTDDARTAISAVQPDQYPAETAKHVDAVRAAADELTGDQGALAKQVAEALAKAAAAQPGSIEFTDLFNQFVELSNQFNHAYCNVQDNGD